MECIKAIIPNLKDAIMIYKKLPNQSIETIPLEPEKDISLFFGDYKKYGQVKVFPVFYKLPDFPVYIQKILSNSNKGLKDHEMKAIARTLFDDLEQYFEKTYPRNVLTRVLYTFIQTYPLKCDNSCTGYVCL
ncbi:MAG: hypothetical protein QM539_10905 [Alphaproteobacteria bacterium]|nr:hypothetical protein [Alphaproteobacteria bacterium]